MRRVFGRQDVVRRWRHRLAPNPWKDRPESRPKIGKRLRRLVWLWWPWAILAIVLTAANSGAGPSPRVCWLV